jgi:mRNA interferase YafQ
VKIVQTNQFRKDIKRALKRGKRKEKLIKILKMLEGEQELPEKYRDHALKGNWIGRRDCHIEPDWVLIYKVCEEQIILERTGTHSDLFE